MQKRLLTILLCMLLLIPAIPVRAEEASFACPDDAVVSAYAIVSQRDARFNRGKRYLYNNDQLSVRGCGPCSIANMLISAFRVTDEEEAAKLLYETIVFMCGRLAPATHHLTVRNLADIAEGLDPDLCPTLFALRQDRGGMYSYLDDPVGADYLAQAVSPALQEGTPALAIAKIDLTDSWREVIRMCTWLHDQGRDDAQVIVSYATAGTGTTKGPFRTESGHFLTYLFRVGEYMRSGSFYLLDSLPRALKTEVYNKPPYWTRYAFVKGYIFTPFREAFTPTRLRETVIRFTPDAARMAGLEALSPDEALDARAAVFAPVYVFGESVITVDLP